MPDRIPLNQMHQIQGRTVFFDANILLYIFWPTAQYRWTTEYSKAYATLKNQNYDLCTNFIVVSEIINRILRIEYSNHLLRNNLYSDDYKFKAYRDSDEGMNTLEDIYTTVESSIINRFDIVEKSISKEEIREFLQVDSLDFNDKAIEKTCLDNDFVLCTNDKDYKDSPVDILTSNPAILNP